MCASKLSIYSSKRQLHAAWLTEETSTEDAEPNLYIVENLSFRLSVKNIWVLSWVANMTRYFWATIKFSNTYPPSSYFLNLKNVHHYLFLIYAGLLPIKIVWKFRRHKFEKMAIYFVIQNSSRKLQSSIKVQDLGKLQAIFISILFLSIIKSHSTGNRVDYLGICQAQGKQLDVKQATWYDSN